MGTPHSEWKREIIAQICRNENIEDVDYKVITLVLIVKFWKKYYNELSASVGGFF